jgi:hypothetical protein
MGCVCQNLSYKFKRLFLRCKWDSCVEFKQLFLFIFAKEG